MTRIYWIIAFLLVAIVDGRRRLALSSLPEQIPTHWNIRGEVDGYGGKWTLFLLPVMMAGDAGAVLLPAGIVAQALRGGSRFVPRIFTSWCSSSACSRYMHGVLLYVVHQAVAKEPTVDLGRAFIGGHVSVLRIDGQRDREGAQELLYRRPRALDAGQRSRVERHPSPGGLGDGRRRR